MEPVKRCVRCKQKKKGCSRGNPCERCALAGLTAEECIYLPEDATFRSVPRKRQPATPKVHYLSTSLGKERTATEIQRCSRCIRTARGCDINRPCGPCAAGGLTEWECRYTSASSFKVRGPGKRPEGSPLVQSLDVEMLRKQVRSGSTGALPDRKSLLVPTDYRTPSPPGNISPISDAWEEAVAEDTSPVLTRPTMAMAVPIPGKEQERRQPPPSEGFLQPPTTGSYPNMMGRLHSQQSHVPESSPQVLADDYQSSPSPFNSPPFQSSPTVFGYAQEQGLFSPLQQAQVLPYPDSALVRAHRQAQQQQHPPTGPFVQYGFGNGPGTTTGTYAGIATSPQLPSTYMYPPPTRSAAGSPITGSGSTGPPVPPPSSSAQRRILGSPQPRHSPQPYLVPSRRGSGVSNPSAPMAMSGSPLGYTLQHQVQKQFAAQQMSRSYSGSRHSDPYAQSHQGSPGLPIAGASGRTGGPVRSAYGSPSAGGNSGELRSLAAQHHLQQQQQQHHHQQQQQTQMHQQQMVEQQLRLQQHYGASSYVSPNASTLPLQQSPLLQPPLQPDLHEGLFGDPAYQLHGQSSESIDGEFPLFGEADMDEDT